MQDPNFINHNWNPPLKLEGTPLLPWPENSFPEPFKSYSTALSQSTETPKELAALIILAVVATSAQKIYEIEIKKSYREPVNIWVLPILPPGSRKSGVYKEAIAPLKEWEKRKKLLVDPIIQSAISKRKTYEGRIKELRIQASRATEEKCEQLQQQVEQLERDLPEIPSYPQLWTGDVTPEQLGSVMAANDQVMAVLSDEGGVFDILAGLYSDGKANIDLFLQAHSAGSVRIDRRSSPPIFMDKAILTIGLTVQPQVIKNACNNKTFRGKGLLGRFLYAIPKSNIGLRSFEEPPVSPALTLQYQSAIKSILDHSISSEKDKAPHVLQLSEKAYIKWLEYAKFIENLMGEDLGILSHITDWAGKLPGAIARIAALLHIMRYYDQNPWEHLVSIDDMKAAIDIGHALKNHALIVFDLLHESGDMQLAKNVLEWIKLKHLQSFTLRDCKRKFRREKESIPSALIILEEREIIKEQEPTTGIGRRSEIFNVNPLLFDA